MHHICLSLSSSVRVFECSNVRMFELALNTNFHLDNKEYIFSACAASFHYIFCPLLVHSLPYFFKKHKINSQALLCFNSIHHVLIFCLIYIGNSPQPQDIIVGRVYSYDNIYKLLILSKCPPCNQR